MEKYYKRTYFETSSARIGSKYRICRFKKILKNLSTHILDIHFPQNAIFVRNNKVLSIVNRSEKKNRLKNINDILFNTP